jgi:hypothetical protein
VSGKDGTFTWGMSQTVQEMQKLMAHGVVGIYRSFEITEIFGFQPGKHPINFLTLAVAESAELPADDDSETLFLNRSPLKLHSTDWKVGIVRYRISLQTLMDAVNHFSQTGDWKPKSEPLQVGALRAAPSHFVPADSLEENPWNRVLKNNFWEGSHVLELFDTTKQHVQFLLDNSRLLTSLTQLISPYAPIAVDGLSDRLGNILIQLPVTAIATAVRGSHEGHQTVTVGWHPRVSPRPIRITSEIYGDARVEAYDSAVVTAGSVTLKLNSHGGGARTHVWDEENRVLLGATLMTNFITSISLSMHGVGSGNRPRTREFQLPHGNNDMKLQSVFIRPEETPHIIGSTHEKPQKQWQHKRVFKKSLLALEARKEFVQYGPVADRGRVEALDDIRWLMEQHGSQGVWLWDPYLQADDILQTLFFCPHDDAGLMALTAGKEPPSCNSKDDKSSNHEALTPRVPSWEERQALRLETAKGDCRGLRLEFRISKGHAGSSFHDRFIIFPRKDDSAIAWSLGTSVNSLGKQHHILQKVSDGQLIADSFRKIWDKLDAPEHAIWKTP